MRIMFFYAGGDFGGAKPHILNLAKELSKNNDLRLVCFRIGETSEEAKALGIDTKAIESNIGWKATKRFAFDQICEFDPDVVHCHGSKANLLGILVKKKFGKTVITTVHSNPDMDYMGAPLRNISYGNLNRWALKHMDYYVAVGPAMQDLLIGKGFDPYKISYIYNAIDFSDGCEWHNCGETVNVGIAARLDPVKNIETLVRAFAVAFEQDKRLRLSIAGIGEEESRLKHLVKELNIDGVTSFEGWVNDMSAYFKRIDINVLCSLSETFPYSILEAAHEKVPSVASNVGAIPSLIIDGENGLIFEAGDYRKFAEHIIRLASDDDLRKQFGEKIFSKAKEEFSLTRMCCDQENIYRRLIKRKTYSGRHGAVLCGAYGKGNAGDDAILTAIIRSMHSIDDDMPICVLSRQPDETKLQNKVDSIFTFNIFALRKVLKRSKLFISGGGTLIQDVTSTRSLMYYLYTLKTAKQCGCKVEMYGCGIGPINSPSNREKTANVLNKYVDVITLRDSSSGELLKDIGVTVPEVIPSADPAVNLPDVSSTARWSALSKLCISPETRKIVFCLRPWKNFNDYTPIIDAAEYVYEKYGLVSVFVPMEYPRDVNIGEEIGSRIKTPHYVSSVHYSIEELRAILADAEHVVSMRLHALVFSAALGTPIVALSYDPKVEGFVKDSKAGEVIRLEELSSDKLFTAIDRLVAGGRTIGEETRCRLRELEKINAAEAAKLLGE